MPGHWERWTHLSHRYVLPVAAGTAVAFGAALLTDFQPGVVRYLPELLIAVGGVALSTSFAFLAARRRESLARASAEAHAPFRRARPLRPPVVRPDPAGALPGSGAGAPWPAAYARTSPTTGSLTSSSAGDALWHEWLPTGIEKLGAEVVGPVPETLYSQVPAEGGGIIARRDEDLLFLEQLAEGLAEDASPRGGFPTAPQGGSAGGLSVSELTPTPVELEALNAIPPYLRLSVGLESRRTLPSAVPSPVAQPPVPSVARASCSTCLVTLGESRWQPCPGCYQPICTDCVVDSLVSYGASGCAGCVQGRPLVP